MKDSRFCQFKTDKSLTVGCVRCSDDNREHSERGVGALGTYVSKNFDKIIRLQSEKRKKWIREISRERLQEITEGTSSAPRLTSS